MDANLNCNVLRVDFKYDFKARASAKKQEFGGVPWALKSSTTIALMPFERVQRSVIFYHHCADAL